MLILTIGQSVFSQNNIPIIKANSLNVNILDKRFKQNSWTIMPEVKPDIYFTDNVISPIIFYTDIDSITIQLKPDKEYNFIILVNDKDSAYTQIKYKESNLDVLKVAWEYNYSDNRPLNNYNYNLTDSSDLLIIRNKFKLDSIAANGNETSKIINLLKWVNFNFKYDGTKNAPSFNSVSDLMIKCKNGEGTLHCGAMAWVMVDCYSSMGFIAKQIVCYPKDSSDHECHSTVAVYSKDLKKWLFVDPSNCTYAMNEDNEILSFEEFRDALINNKTIKLNSEANNNRHELSSEYYFDYIAKNFYAFQCFSEKDGESISNLLLPIEYVEEFSHTLRNYPKVTNNPNEFWVKPEK